MEYMRLETSPFVVAAIVRGTLTTDHAPRDATNHPEPDDLDDLEGFSS